MARPILSTISIILLAGGIVLEFFVILSGVHGIADKTPLNKTYFLQADTSGISGTNPVPNPARWAFFSICGVHDGNNANCGPEGAAIPFDPMRNFGTSNNVPPKILAHAKLYYYLSRVAWGFYIIAIFFACIAFLLSVFALCSRLAAKFTGLITACAMVAQAVCASLMTAWTVRADSAFRANGQTAQLGRYLYGFTWGAFACWLISTILFCIGGGKDKNESSGGGGYFGRKRSTRSRGSFRDSESGRRVKDEYD